MKNKNETIFENFIEYCKEDNEQLAKNIETWLADYFDIPNRTIPMEWEEVKWIKENLGNESQRRILGIVLPDTWLKDVIGDEVK
jgi:hypothetical protein